MPKDEILSVVQRAIAAKGYTIVAKETGVNRSTLYRHFKPGGNPTFKGFMAVVTNVGVDLSASAKV